MKPARTRFWMALIYAIIQYDFVSRKKAQMKKRSQEVEAGFRPVFQITISKSNLA